VAVTVACPGTTVRRYPVASTCTTISDELCHSTSDDRS
jgi:hypothetical protein